MMTPATEHFAAMQQSLEQGPRSDPGILHLGVCFRGAMWYVDRDFCTAMLATALSITRKTGERGDSIQ